MKRTLQIFALVSCCYPLANAQNITTIAGNGTKGYYGDGGLAIAGENGNSR